MTVASNVGSGAAGTVFTVVAVVAGVGAAVTLGVYAGAAYCFCKVAPKALAHSKEKFDKDMKEQDQKIVLAQQKEQIQMQQLQLQKLQLEAAQTQGAQQGQQSHQQ